MNEARNDRFDFQNTNHVSKTSAISASLSQRFTIPDSGAEVFCPFKLPHSTLRWHGKYAFLTHCQLLVVTFLSLTPMCGRITEALYVGFLQIAVSRDKSPCLSLFLSYFQFCVWCMIWTFWSEILFAAEKKAWLSESQMCLGANPLAFQIDT